MNCTHTTDWIWETEHPEATPPDGIAAHLLSCTSCKLELDARQAISLRLRSHRTSLEEEPPPGIERMVLDAAQAATKAHETGDFGVLQAEVEDEFSDGLGARITSEVRALMSGEFDELDEDDVDDIAESIAEEYGSAIALMTTNRLQVADGPPPDEVPRSPREVKQNELGLVSETATSAIPVSPWSPPRASSQWMLSATALLILTAGLGFLAGRATTSNGTTATLPAIHTTFATGLQRAGGKRHPRLHDVRLSEGAVEALSEGNTYLLTGPVGGPYEVVGIVGWDTTDSELQARRDDQGEIVIAVGPAGGWSRGTQLAVSALADPNVEIIGRRALP
jgi:hypothetical protein